MAAGKQPAVGIERHPAADAGMTFKEEPAPPAFVASFLGWVAGAVYAFALSDGIEAMGSMWPMQIVIGGACVFFIWYAWMMGRKGVLR